MMGWLEFPHDGIWFGICLIVFVDSHMITWIMLIDFFGIAFPTHDATDFPFCHRFESKADLLTT